MPSVSYVNIELERADGSVVRYGFQPDPWNFRFDMQREYANTTGTTYGVTLDTLGYIPSPASNTTLDLHANMDTFTVTEVTHKDGEAPSLKEKYSFSSSR